MGAGGDSLSERPVYPLRSTFANAVEKIRLGNGSRSRVPVDDRDNFATDRLHPRVSD